jgi:Ca-activated chloride channel family protein
MGIAFVWLVALIAPFAFRRGWASSLAIFALLGGSLAAAPARADAQDWLQRPDQRGAAAFGDGRHSDAAELFEDPAWRAASLYRDGRFDEAALLLESAEDTTSLYNRGNALARAGRLEDAIAAYDTALERNPEHGDAEFNRELVAKLLEEQQREQQQSDSSQDSGDESESQPSQDSDSESGQDSEGSDEADAQPQTDPANGEPSTPESEEAQRGEEEPEDEENRRADADPSDDDQPEDREGAEPQPGTPEDQESDAESEATHSEMANQPLSERDQAVEQWLDRITDDPGGLLREKLRRKYARQRYEDAMKQRNRNR